ncbi:MAG: LTA synthase family protein [Clostridia bacterium]|nr:LTA synthase family protein [Clostridia bacterium]
MKNFFAKIAGFFTNEPNFKALFSKIPKEAERMPSRAERARMRRKRNTFFFLFFPLSIFYMEVVYNFSLGNGLPIVTLLMLFLFSFAYGFLINGIALLLPLSLNRLFTLLALIISTLLIVSQCIYFNIFGGYYTISLMDMAGEAMGDFTDMIFVSINRALFTIVLLFIPLVIYIVKYKKYSPTFSPTTAFRIYPFIVALLLHLLAGGIISLDREVGTSNNHYYRNEFDVNESIKRFGVITSVRLDINNLIFGTEEIEIELPTPNETVFNPFTQNSPGPSGSEQSGSDEQNGTDEQGETDTPVVPIVYGDNVMDIDFDTLIANEKNKDIKAMHEYFASLTPTKQNKYTGMFKGKNLIYITLEGFSYKTIDKERTPTLYKMANEGFVFKNSYTSLWGGSTATGEYAAMSGNFHQSAKCLGWLDGNTMPFTLGTQFNKLGYTVYAFHNHTYDYYSRNLSHKAMGYEYYGIGNGLEKAPINENGDTIKSAWPRSDHEMAQATLPYFINSDKPFHIYYMTVSGHANYNFGGNKMSKKHQDIVANLDASDAIKAYHACQYEVELMLKELVDALEAAGKLNDTVFVMSADHYPYALDAPQLKELYGITTPDVYDNLDLLRNSLIIYCADMKEPVVVEKPCSSIDLLPTVSNLFGLEYDSRLLMGTDILSDSDPLVILLSLFTGPNWCWMNQYGTYNPDTGVFTTAEGFSATKEQIDEYVKEMNKVLNAKRKYSPMILNKDYYSYIF